MCDPVTIAIVASAAVSAAGAVQADKNADAQAKYQQQVHAQNTKIADANAKSGYLQLGRRVLQEREAAAAGLAEVSKRSAAARSTALVAAGGTTGRSVDALLGDFALNELAHQTATERNLEWVEAQAELQGEGIRRGQQAQILSTLPQPVERPNFALATARIATNALSQYVSLTESTPGEGFLGRSYT